LRRTGDQDEDGKEGFSDVTKFHGQVCPGTAIGYRAAKIATGDVSLNSLDKELVAMVEQL
jgi:formylmethanofuran dehydrogenase subunit E